MGARQTPPSRYKAVPFGVTFSARLGGGKVSLSSGDPLAKPRGRSILARRRRLRAEESFGVLETPPGYVPLEDGGTIVR